ncbi:MULTISPECIES: sigma-70 family RNA polymerase sigma factor [unclassified Luteibacter]|uniref:sigma-70 family RNA polymerase sigma factor n=1 Tax=unclassified Luteibacter TaxID=2620188 RepID=UPI0008B8D171|nr:MULTISPECIES: sigma-70 family RNA polymerase sigma factor [unclassified Luteibacter]MDR6937554.1 RNA polymerase sigma-70 factor (ECF subfamily) [Luteibacter sp. 3190]SEO36129.1 RNA polymerase sigma-70 factor, ECF subfamily [Luteibacter sp. UNC138MFCol5.1]SEW23530.1 RNA polymerase sigma-70 factor, ECF subfamily [Luteibacter sp. 329MFSha]
MAPVKKGVNPRQRQYEAMVRALSADLYRYAYWLSRSEATAQDLVQETFLRAWKNLDSLRDAESAKPWLFTILRREHARLYERKRFETVELDDTVAEDAPFASPERSGDAAQVRDAILRLPEKYRDPLAMQVLGGMTGDEIAERTGQQPGAVMTQLFRARQRLKDLLGGRAVAEGGRK